MTVVSGELLPVGLRYVQLMELDSNGYPKATATTVYEGLQMVGGKAFTLTVPDSRIISHIGDDRVLAQDILPPLESTTCELRVARNDMDVYAILTNTKVTTLGEAKLVGMGTSQMGFEPDLALFMYQQAVEASTGARVWRSFLIPKARIVPKVMGMQENPAEHIFQVLVKNSSKHIWGTAVSLATEGFTSVGILEMMTQYRPVLATWQADGVVAKFLFSTDKPAALTTKIHGVWVNSVVDPTVTKALDGVTPTTLPSDNDMVVCLYEEED